jgi:predicted lipid-binding transport protein (Tim44 family)
MSTTTATSAPPRSRRRPGAADPNPDTTRIGSVMLDRRPEPARGASDAPRPAARPCRHGWQRAGAVIGGVAAVVLLGTLSS